MKKAKENSGITLVALIVLIIVMAILITTAIYSGVGSIKYVRFMKIKSEIETLQASVNSWYEKNMNGDESISQRGQVIDPDDYENELGHASGIENENYRLYTAKYLVEDIGVDGIENDYLISVKDRDVILIGGLIYQGELYYTDDDFEIYETEVDAPISSVSFNLHCGNNPKNLKEECIFIHNIHFYDNGREIKVSKFNIEYSIDGTNWNTINSSTSKTKYNENDAYLFKIKDDGTYQVKITDRKGKYIPTNINDETEIKSIEVFNCSYPSFKDNNWQIYTPRQLRFLAEYVNKGYTLRTEEDTEEKTKLEKVVENAGHIASDIPEVTESTWIYLMNDLDLGARPGEGSTDEEKWENNTKNATVIWEPIGIGKPEDGNSLIASFDGQNHTIKGVYVNRNVARSGIFGTSNTIKNLTVKNSYIKGANLTATIAGRLESGNIENCNVINTIVVGTQSVGAIVGNNRTGIAIKNCTSEYNTVKGNQAVGGIVGNVQTEDGYVENCNNKNSTVQGDYIVGGIVGQILGVSIKKCSNSGTISCGDNGTGGSYCGGIAGLSYYSSVSDCYNTGNIKATGGQVGGICGTQGYENKTTTIENCYNIATVEGTDRSIGGIAGYVTGDATVKNTFNSGAVICNYLDNNQGTGGIVGTIDNTSLVKNSYNKGNVTVVEGGSLIGAIIGKNSGTGVSSNSYYINSLTIGAINGADDIANNLRGTTDNFDNLESFLNALTSGTIN